MYLKKIRLKNIKCFGELEIDFSDGEGVRLWTTLFGENALGKSTLLQAIGAMLAGPSAMRELLPVAEGWVRKGQPYGEIYAELLRSDEDAATRGPARKTPYLMQYLVSGNDPAALPESLDDRPTVAEMIPWSGEPGTTKSDAKSRERARIKADRRLLQETAYAENTTGWLACGYGPFRRLSGDSPASNSIVSAGRRAARFVTLFKEDAALTNATKWLTDLHNEAREDKEDGRSARVVETSTSSSSSSESPKEDNGRSARVLETVKNSIATQLFPEPTELIVTAKSAFLKRNGSTEILFQNLSDGYRSMLALFIDLLHWLTEAFPDNPNPLSCPGIALIDELDTHLHPSWQRTIGHWLREKFPKIQFIIATHSPFIAQVADVESGAIESTTKPAGNVQGNIRLKESPKGVIAEPSAESARLLGPEQILQSDLFDMSTVRSPQVEKSFERFDQLKQKQTGNNLSPEDAEELKQLQLELELLPAASTAEGRAVGAALRGAVQKFADKIRDIE